MPMFTPLTSFYAVIRIDRVGSTKGLGSPEYAHEETSRVPQAGQCCTTVFREP